MEKRQILLRDTVRNIFTRYLFDHNLRRTPERYAILDEIYCHQGHFDIEKLYSYMKEKHYRVSRATLYNTIELLLDSKLVIKHQFGKNQAQFERAMGVTPHEHLICLTCGEVIEVENKATEKLIESVAKPNNFEVSHHTLYIFGRCKKCHESDSE